MKNEIQKIDVPELQAIETSKAEKIKATFLPMSEMLSSFEEAYEDLIRRSQNGIDEEITSQAKRLRIDIGKVRIETGKLKDQQKEYIKLEDKAIMGVHNILVWAVKEKEDRLKEIENHFEIQEQKRLEKLNIDRAEKLSKYVDDAYERDLAKLDEDEFEALLQMKKQQKQDQIKAEEEAERRRKEEAEEARRIKEENEKLQKENELAKKLLQEKQEEEERRQKEEELKRQADLHKGDADKVADLITDLSSLKAKYTFTSEKNKRMYSDVSTLIDKIITHINKYEFITFSDISSREK